MRQVESETATSELKLSNTTGRLLLLEREVGLLRQNSRDVNQLEETAKVTSEQAKANAEEAQKVSHTSTAAASHIGICGDKVSRVIVRRSLTWSLRTNWRR